MTSVIGPDVSFYQDDPNTAKGIDFAKMRDAGASFVIIRAGQNLWNDRDVVKNWKAAKAAGLPRGCYWFYDSRVDPKRQAEKWVSVMENDFGELPMFCDFEDTYGGPYGKWQNWFDFIERLKTLVPNEIGIYSNYYYWKEHTLDMGISIQQLGYFQQYPFWVANYNPGDPLIPLPWKTWTFWQFASKGRGDLYGVESLNIDLNYFNGGPTEFKARFKLDSAVPALPPEVETTDTVIKVRLIHKSGKTLDIPA